ncbi:MAG: hypothetical protein HYS75_06445 [Nitrosopumilales archaeon]|nr:hypothetical protein [Nitrosopumilales archaeon]
MPETKITKSLVVKGNIAAVYGAILTKLTNLNFEKSRVMYFIQVYFCNTK